MAAIALHTLIMEYHVRIVMLLHFCGGARWGLYHSVWHGEWYHWTCLMGYDCDMITVNIRDDGTDDRCFGYPSSTETTGIRCRAFVILY